MQLRTLCIGLILSLSSTVHAQHLWWDLNGQTKATCLYGEITVLATYPHIYYCGANWHPGEPAGGYCGIQDNELNERRTIFSIWDTSDKLHPKPVAADPRTVTGRFGGEGEGGHTHMVWPWKTGQTFRFFVQKVPGKTPDTTDAKYFLVDLKTGKWFLSATIESPDGGQDSVKTIGGGMSSFLENFAGEDKDVARLATYRLWLGEDADHLQCLTKAGGDGQWGELNDAYFLANGSTDNLNKVFTSLEKDLGKPTWGEKDKPLDPITDKRIESKTLAAIQKLATTQPVK